MKRETPIRHKEKKKLGDDVVKELQEQVPVKSRFLEMFRFGEDKILSSLT